MAEFECLWRDGPVFEQAENFRFGTDSILLGNFIGLSGVKRGIDLGCSAGVITLLLLTRSERLRMCALEINAGAAETAARNMERNHLTERCEVYRGDIRECRKLFPTGSFDLVIANPPYFPAGAGLLSQDDARATARGEVECTLQDLCKAAAYLCRWGGKVGIVYRPERLPELFAAMMQYGIEPKRMRLACHNAHSAPCLVLVEGKRGGKPGLSVEPVLFIRKDDGTESDEIRRIYHR